MVPVGSIFDPPGSARTISGIPKWYDFPANWGMDYATFCPPFRGTRFPTIDLREELDTGKDHHRVGDPAIHGEWKNP